MQLNRFTAAAIHFTASAVIGGIVYFVMVGLWYPGGFFSVAGGRDLFLLIVGVDVCLGPLITMIVFVPGKRGLRFDLACIAIAQLTALAYGGWVIFESRPAYIVFVKDRFELARANQVQEITLATGVARPNARLSLTGPLLVGARMPTDPAVVSRLIDSAFAGADLQTYSEYHIPYDEVRSEVRAKALPIARLRRLNPSASGEIDRILARAGLTDQQAAFLPLRAGKADLAALVDSRNGDVVYYAALRPWEY